MYGIEGAFSTAGSKSKQNALYGVMNSFRFMELAFINPLKNRHAAMTKSVLMYRTDQKLTRYPHLVDYVLRTTCSGQLTIFSYM